MAHSAGVYVMTAEGLKAAATVPGPQNLVVSPDAPNLTEPGLWIQTFPSGDITLWVRTQAGTTLEVPLTGV